jgi:hypothetical protein
MKERKRVTDQDQDSTVDMLRKEEREKEGKRSQVKVSLGKNDVTALETIAREEGTSTSALIRRAVKEMLKKART